MFRCKHEANRWKPFATAVSLDRMITAVRGPLTTVLCLLPSDLCPLFFDIRLLTTDL